MLKGDLSDFDGGMVFGARQAGLRIPETAIIQGFYHTTIRSIYRRPSLNAQHALQMGYNSC